MTVTCAARVSAVAAGILALASCVRKPATLPDRVITDLEEAASMCRDVGGKPLLDRALQRADLNSDGHDDFVIDIDSINCEGAASVYGDREKGVLVYAGDGRGAAEEVFSDTAYGVRVERMKGAATLWLTVSGAMCGAGPAPDFARETFCDRPLQWDASTHRFIFAPVATARMIR